MVPWILWTFQIFGGIWGLPPPQKKKKKTYKSSLFGEGDTQFFLYSTSTTILKNLMWNLKRSLWKMSFSFKIDVNCKLPRFFLLIMWRFRICCMFHLQAYIWGRWPLWLVLVESTKLAWIFMSFLALRRLKLEWRTYLVNCQLDPQKTRVTSPMPTSWRFSKTNRTMSRSRNFGNPSSGGGFLKICSCSSKTN